MKRIGTLVILSFAFNFLTAQESLIAGLQNEKEVRLYNSTDEKSANDEKRYVFKDYNLNSKPKGEVETHFMGDTIAVKWTLFNELYTRKTEVTIGFGSSYTETLKPAVFNAVYRMNTFYKKAIGRKTINVEIAKKQFSWILDCAIAICHSPDSSEFELALAKIKNPDQLLNLFNKVKIEKI